MKNFINAFVTELAVIFLSGMASGKHVYTHQREQELVTGFGSR